MQSSSSQQDGSFGTAGRDPRQPDEFDYARWLRFWIGLAILIMFALVGTFIAADERAGDYACGLTLTFASLALAAMRIKARFDGEEAGLASFLLVDNWPSLIIAGIVYFAIALVGIFVAADYSGTFYTAGLALAGVATLAFFLSLKNVFDHLDRH